MEITATWDLWFTISNECRRMEGAIYVKERQEDYLCDLSTISLKSAFRVFNSSMLKSTGPPVPQMKSTIPYQVEAIQKRKLWQFRFVLVFSLQSHSLAIH